MLLNVPVLDEFHLFDFTEKSIVQYLSTILENWNPSRVKETWIRINKIHIDLIPKLLIEQNEIYASCSHLNSQGP